MNYVIIGVFALVIIGGLVFTFLSNNKIKKNGIATEAQITRIDIKETETINNDTGLVETETTKTYYVTYNDASGNVTEAKLNNPKMGLKEGDFIKIKYLPEKPNKVVRIN